jgi:hypothetical protein
MSDKGLYGIVSVMTLAQTTECEAAVDDIISSKFNSDCKYAQRLMLMAKWKPLDAQG